jgi:hypothetical protein
MLIGGIVMDGAVGGTVLGFETVNPGFHGGNLILKLPF